MSDLILCSFRSVCMGANRGAVACALSGKEQLCSSPAFLNIFNKAENQKLVFIQI